MEANNNNNKVSIRQIVIVFIISIASPIIRVIPRYSAEIAKSASWLMPFFATPMFLIFLFILNGIVGKKDNKTLDQQYNEIFGKLVGKVLAIIYIVWIFVIISTYLRYFADRLSSSIYVATSNKIFIFTMLLLVYYATRRDFKFFARYIEFVMILFLIFIIFTFFTAIPTIKIDNLTPVTTNDSLNILKSTQPIMGIYTYITFMFFLGDKISNKQEFKKQFKLISIIIFFTSLVVLLVTVGTFGYKLTSDLNLPFFAFFKNIQILEIIERIESLLIIVWMVTDFCIISTFTFIEMNLIKNTFNLESSKEVITPILIMAYILAISLGSNLFEMINFSKYLFLPGNIILGIGIPIIAFIIGKIRRKI